MTRALPDLPLIECVTNSRTAKRGEGDVFAVFMSGDGGWARFDRSIARHLVSAGLPVVGWSALRYFWRARTPDAVARDLARVIETYAERWQRRRVVLIGFSRGADILPFACNRLAARPRAAIARLVLFGVTERIAFQYRLRDWLGLGRLFPQPTDMREILPELARLPAGFATCINGAADPMAADAQTLSRAGAETIVRPGGHHIGHDHAGLARLVLDRIADAR